jgi:predicted MPP superfamily phosphohydrolase
MLRAFKQIVFFYVLSLLLAILVFSCTRVGKLPTIEASCSTTLPTQIKSVETNGYRFYILSDWGFNGHFQQLEVAQAMSVAAETASPKMIISCGDNFQVNGVQSVNDPLWMTNFEQVYTHPGLLVDWYAVLGNHDYRGNTQALIDYSGISRRWRMPARYYSFVREINDSTHARFVFLDTPALMSYYWERGNDYPDITKQDSAIQMAWLRETLINASEDWVFVFGHHPLYSASPIHAIPMS